MANNSIKSIKTTSNNNTSKRLLDIYKSKNNSNAIKKISTNINECGKCNI